MEPQGTDQAEIGGTLLSILIPLGIWVIPAVILITIVALVIVRASGKKPAEVGKSS